MKMIKIILTTAFIVLLTWLVYLAILPEPPIWTGFGERIKDPNMEPAKTLFDWLKLIIIPLSLGFLAWIYKEAEKSIAKKNEEERSKNETIDSFFTIMSELLMEHKLTNNPRVEVKAMAKTRINIALNQLDGVRKGTLLQFLYESDLINHNPEIKLLGANFNDIILDHIVLGSAEIRGAYFKKASIKDANLNGIILNSSNLEKANLSGSQVENADFGYTNLKKCKLKNMDLTMVDFEGANLTKANLKGSIIRQSQLDSIISKQGIQLSKKKII